METSRGIIYLFYGLSCILAITTEANGEQIPPPGKAGYPVQVSSSMFILDISDVNEKTMEFTAQFYFRQTWIDERLKFEGNEDKVLTVSEIEAIWKPDLFFIQELRGKLHSITVPNIFARLSPDGRILYSMRLTMAFRCAMDLRYYPHDTQSCKFHIESYGFTANDVILSWVQGTNTSTVDISKEINLPNFEILNLDYGSGSVQLGSKTYGVLSVEITFRRKIGFFLTKIFVPYIMLVATSWLGFWIHPRFVVQRLSLLLAILLLMAAIAMDLNSNIPYASYTKGIDVWSSFCISLVFAAFLEFLYVSTIAKKSVPETSDKSVIVSGLDLESNEKKSDEGKLVYFGRKITDQGFLKASNRMDSFLRLVYPLVFVFFNLVYWCYFAA